MSRSRLMILFGIGICLTVFPQTGSAELPSSLLQFVPAEANAIVLMDAEALFQTPLGRRENWKHRAADQFANQQITIPPEALRVVLASQLDLGGTLHPAWELGIVELEHTPSFPLIARRQGGLLDTIAGHSAVRVDGRTLVAIKEGVILGTPESSRQVIARWVKGLPAASPPATSGYLREAAESLPATCQLAFALDLSDSVTVAPVREMLSQWEPLAGKTADQADLADVLASVRGVVIAVTVTDHRTATVRVDLGRPAALLKPYAKPLTEEILRNLSISLLDFDHWTAAVGEKTLTLNGELSEGDMLRLLSLVAASPATQAVQEPAEETPRRSADEITADASQRYFQSVKNHIDELRKQLNKSRDNHVVWMERYARKIDDLPMKDVDKDLLVFGGNVSNSLRYQAQAGRMGALRAGVREAQPVYQNYSYGVGAVGPYGSYGSYSFSGSVRASPDRNQIRMEEHASAAQVKIAEMKQIEDGLVQIRRIMTERYHREF